MNFREGRQEHAEARVIQTKFNREFNELCDQRNLGVTTTIREDDLGGKTFTIGRLEGSEGNYSYSIVSNQEIEDFISVLKMSLKNSEPDYNWDTMVRSQALGSTIYIDFRPLIDSGSEN